MITEIQGRKLRLLISAPGNRTSGKGARDSKSRRIIPDKNPVLIGILKGGFIFLADLVRQIDFNVEIDFVRASSYKEGMEPGEIELVTDVVTPLKGRHVDTCGGYARYGCYAQLFKIRDPIPRSRRPSRYAHS